MSGTTGGLREIMGAIDAEHLAWAELARSVPRGEASHRPAGGWSVIDYVVHVASWKANAAQVARLQAAPEAPDLDPDAGASIALGIDVDPFNDEFMAAHRDWTLEQAIEFSERTHEELKGALRALPAERLFGGPWPHGARRWYWRPAVVHPGEHRDEFEARKWEG